MTQIEHTISTELFSTACVYSLQFNKDKHIYVGQTRNLMDRISQHKNNTRKVNHRLQKAFELWDYRIVILAIECDEKKRLNIESSYISKLEASLNVRLNGSYCVKGKSVDWSDYIGYELTHDWDFPQLKQYLFICDLPKNGKIPRSHHR
jgi:excinuclease UvrABC nuclease subunit